MNELSVQQQELLLEQLIYPESAFYNVGGCLVVQGGLKTEILQKVMDRIADLNPILGARLAQGKAGFEWDYGVFETQYFLNPSALDGLSFDEAEASCRQDFTIPFDLLQGRPLYKITGKSFGDRFLIYCKFHHIILDGYGFQVLTGWFMELYNQLAANPHKEPVIRMGDYRDFVNTSQSYLKSEQYHADKSFWQAGLESVIRQNPEVGTISTQKSTSTKSRQSSLFYTQEVFQLINEKCAEAKINPFHYAVAV